LNLCRIYSLNYIINNCGTNDHFTTVPCDIHLLKLQTQSLTTELTPLRFIIFIMIRQKYYIAHFHFNNKFLINQKSIIKKSSYILFHDENYFYLSNMTVYNFTNLIAGTNFCECRYLKNVILFYIC